MALSFVVKVFLPILPPIITRCFLFRSCLTAFSTPLLLKPIRLINPWSSVILNERGLGLPGCGLGVTVPISMNENPKFEN